MEAARANLLELDEWQRQNLLDVPGIGIRIGCDRPELIPLRASYVTIDDGAHLRGFTSIEK
jgi:hypothetical protein